MSPRHRTTSLLVLVLAAGLVTGCLHRPRARTLGVAVSAASLVAGAVLIGSALHYEDHCADGDPNLLAGICGVRAVPAELLGGVLAVAGTTGLLGSVFGAAPPPERTVPPTQLAQRLHAEAVVAARAGRCRVARLLVERAASAAPGTPHVGDPELAQCLP